MKSGHILLLFLIIVFIHPVYASHYCTTVRADAACPSGAPYTVYIGYNYTNTHVNYSGGDSDNFKQCCSFISDTRRIGAHESCSSYGYTAELFDTYQTNDSHVARPGGLTESDNFRLCVNNSVNRVECIYQENSRSEPTGYVPVAYLFQNFNSHVELVGIDAFGSPDLDYDNSVMCRVIPTAPRMVGLDAIDNQTLRIKVEDRSNNEEWFMYYGDLSSPAVAYVGNNSSITQGGTGRIYEYDWTGLTANTTYYARSRVIDDDGTYSDFSNELKRSTNASVPQNVRIAVIDDNTLNISWDANGNPDDTIYTLFWGALNETSEINNVLGTTTSTWMLHSGLRDDYQYCYKSRAMNSEGVHSANSTSNCGSTSFTPAYGFSTWFDPAEMSVPQEGFVRTYLFINNSGNVPDRFGISFTYAPEEISVTPSSAVVDIPAGGVDRIEITVTANSITNSAILIANVESSGSGSTGNADFTLSLMDILGIPGLSNIGIAALSILGVIALLIA